MELNDTSDEMFLDIFFFNYHLPMIGEVRAFQRKLKMIFSNYIKNSRKEFILMPFYEADVPIGLLRNQS